MRTPTAAAAALLTAAAAMAPAAGMAQPVGGGVIAEQAAGQVLSDTYIGAHVVARSAEGLESVGQVTSLVLDREYRLVGVVVEVGGFLGLGAKSVGLAWNALTEERSDGELLLKTDLTPQDFDAAPAFQTHAEQQVESDRRQSEPASNGQ